jgi:hypothetical protein
MAPDNQPPPRAPVREPSTVRMDAIVVASGRLHCPTADDRVTCETFEDANRAAYLCATRAWPCELIVRDAYGRVVQHELIDGDRQARQARRGRSSAEPVDLSVRN